MRILLAAHDVEPALDLLGALEDAGHRVEHVFDLEEALLRAAIAWPDVVVVDVAPDGVDTALLRKWADEHVIPVVLSAQHRRATGWDAPSSRGRRGSSGAAQDVERIARRIGAVAFVRPSGGDAGEWAAIFVDVVETAARRAADAATIDDDDMDPTPTPRRRSGTMEAPREVLLATRGTSALEVIGSLVRTSLGLRCAGVRSAAEALSMLRDEGRFKAVLLDRRLLVEPEGRDLSALLADRHVPVVTLRVPDDDDPATLGRTAWEAIPPLRAALAAARKARTG